MEVEVRATTCLGWVVGVVLVVLPTLVVVVWLPAADPAPVVVDVVAAAWGWSDDERLLPA